MITRTLTTIVLAAAVGLGGYAYGQSSAAPVVPTVAAQWAATAPCSAAPTAPAAAPVAPAQPPAQSAGKVDLNHASDAELDKLPDIGTARIGHITAARPIQSIDDLAGPGMPASVIAMLKARATV